MSNGNEVMSREEVEYIMKQLRTIDVAIQFLSLVIIAVAALSTIILVLVR